MAIPSAVFLSFRLGGDDGVSVETRKWDWALRSLGFETRRVAGEFGDQGQKDDVLLPFLAISPVDETPDPQRLGASLRGADLVVVENLCSLPLNVVASRTAATVLGGVGGHVVFHHHDLPWERPELSGVDDFPPSSLSALHVAISNHARCSLRQHGIDAVTIYNAFDLDPPQGDRASTRDQLGFGTDDLVVLQPTRAIPRKGVGAGLRLAEQLADLVSPRPVRYWLTGPAEDRYGPTLRRLVSAAAVPVTQGRVERVADAYAAADLVVVPSSWEGFGNPAVEAVIARRPVAAAPYRTLAELSALGVDFLPLSDASEVAAFLRRPDLGRLARSRDAVARELSLELLPGRLAAAFEQMGWEDW